MSATHWDLLYGRPPLSRDAILFGVALALHFPLFLMQFKGVVRSKDHTPSFVEIRERDAAIERILQRGVVLPPELPPEVVHPVDLSGLIKIHDIRPVFVSPKEGIQPKVSSDLPVVVSHKIIHAPVVVPVEEATPLKEDKGKFFMAAGTMGAIEPAISIAGRASKVVSIPTGIQAQPEIGIKSPSPLTSKIHVAPLSPEGPVAVSKAVLKVDARAGTPIAVGKLPAESFEQDVPVIRAKPRTLTEEERRKELFPIHGALKDRPVDRQEVPEYPEWARKQGIESSVQFQFSVTADGRVKDTIEMIKGTGYPELDELARKALLRWIFAPLPPEKGNLIQDGIIEFRFSIK